MRPLRRAIDIEYRQQASARAAHLFAQSPFFRDHQRIACYFSISDEMDTTPLIQVLHQARKSCYLPQVSLNLTDKELHFALYSKGTPLLPNRYHVPEPQNSPEILSACELDVAVLPLLAFDETGTRLGTGGGFYDYTFSFLTKTKKHKPLLVGLAYEIQRVDQLPREAFDVALDGVVTEERVLMTKE